MTSTSNANATQVGGNHYKAHGKGDFQHWDMVAHFKLDYMQGQITKYLFRWREKNGIEDLLKAQHYLQKYLEQAQAAQAQAQPLDPDDAAAIRRIRGYDPLKGKVEDGAAATSYAVGPGDERPRPVGHYPNG